MRTSFSYHLSTLINSALSSFNKRFYKNFYGGRLVVFFLPFILVVSFCVEENNLYHHRHKHTKNDWKNLSLKCTKIYIKTGRDYWHNTPENIFWKFQTNLSIFLPKPSNLKPTNHDFAVYINDFKKAMK